MSRLYAVSLIGLAWLTAGCSGSSGGGDVPGRGNEDAVGMLRQASAAELEASIKAAFTRPHGRTGDVLTTALGTGAAGAAPPPGNFTGTYTVEADVDEFDSVRYDGEHLYIAPRRFINCCVLASTEGSEPQPPPRRAIRILATDPANGSASEVGEIPLEEDISVQGMYVVGDTLLALTSESYYGSFGPFWTSLALWAPGKHGFRVYDVRDPASPALVHDATIDGVFVESRRVGNTVYIVSRYAPRIQGLEYHVATDGQAAQNADILRNMRLDDLLPKVTIDGEARSLVAPDACYVATDARERGHVVLTTVTAIPISDPSATRSACYDEDAYGVYVSTTALYLTELREETASSRSTRIHKFALDSLKYRGSAEIPGLVWRGGQADFRMNEHGGYLRVFVSQYEWDAEDVVDHALFALRESADAPKLEIVGELPNDRRPEEIGKTNEELFGVRFFGERAYAVTFQRIDPLYVIDLSNPSDPKLAGKLEVSGVSDFLHPVTDDLLLGLGLAATGGIKLELFDVSDLARPLSRGSSTLGGLGSESEARLNRHAFMYQADVDDVDRFAIPASVYSEDGTLRFIEAGLYLYEIRNKADPLLATLAGVGALVTDTDGTAPRFVENRAFMHDDTLYFVRDGLVWSAFWNAPSVPFGPF